MHGCVGLLPDISGSVTDELLLNTLCYMTYDNTLDLRGLAFKIFETGWGGGDTAPGPS